MATVDQMGFHIFSPSSQPIRIILCNLGWVKLVFAPCDMQQRRTDLAVRLRFPSRSAARHKLRRRRESHWDTSRRTGNSATRAVRSRVTTAVRAGCRIPRRLAPINMQPVIASLQGPTTSSEIQISRLGYGWITNKRPAESIRWTAFA